MSWIKEKLDKLKKLLFFYSENGFYLGEESGSKRDVWDDELDEKE